MTGTAPDLLEATVAALLEAAETPDAEQLKAALASLYKAYLAQQRQFQRMTRISDRYQAAARESAQALSERSSKQLRHLEKITRLSDRYQKMLRDLNDALAEASTHDLLTGLGNRRRMLERLKEGHQVLQRYHTPFCVSVLDVDHFKKVNDTYGHDAGDVVLVQMARALEAGLRQTDACARWGGEEFVILLPNTRLSAAAGVVEAIRESIANRDIVADDQVLRITASFGLVEAREGETVAETIKRADEALYRAKHGGRNAVVLDDAAEPMPD